MVVALEPVRFYGRSLPRPQFYKSNEDRVDPPVSILDPLMSWAEKAHWSMGGVSFKRHRLQGRIEGSIDKLRAECEETTPEKEKGSLIASPESPPMPPAPYVLKRKRRLVDESEDVDQSGLARKLEFEEKEVEPVEAVAGRTRSRRNEDVVVEVVDKVKAKGEKVKKSLKVESRKRALPRLAKRR
ncbi:hypothetical protein P3S67_016334 [Capsicum chacoense]